MHKMPWTILAASLLAAALGCSNEAAKPLPKPKDEATRRAAQRDRIAADFKQVAEQYKKYNTDTKEPSSKEFWTYMDKQKELRPINMIIMEQQYNIQVPDGGSDMIAYETDPDFEKTRVVGMSDGTVNKALPEDDFQQLLKKGKKP
jgi:hypothetical protein